MPGRNKFTYPEGKDYVPPLCKGCSNFADFCHNAKETDASLSKADLGIIALRSCKRGRTKNLNDPCTILETPVQKADRIIAIITGQTGNNQV